MFDESATRSDGSCCFCRDLVRQDEPLVLGRDSFLNKVCRETEHFAAFPSLSPLCTGHSLLVPKYHVTNMGRTPGAHRRELLSFLHNLAHVIESERGNVVLFEHGVREGEPGGCGVQHAHVHLLPLAQAVAVRVERRLQTELDTGVACDFASFLEERAGETPYLVFGSIRRSLTVAHGTETPSQFLRRLIAQEAGFARWDWREYFGWEAFEATGSLLMAGAVPST